MNGFVKNRSISFNKQTFFDLKNEFIILVCQNGILMEYYCNSKDGRELRSPLMVSFS